MIHMNTSNEVSELLEGTAGSNNSFKGKSHQIFHLKLLHSLCAQALCDTFFGPHPCSQEVQIHQDAKRRSGHLELPNCEKAKQGLISGGFGCHLADQVRVDERLCRGAQ